MKIEEATKQLNDESIYLKGAGIGEQAYFLAKLNSPIFFLASNSENAFKINNQLTALGKQTLLLDSFDNEFLFTKFQSKDNQYKLINALFDLTNNPNLNIITTINGLKKYLPIVETFKANTIKLKIGESYNLEDLTSLLIKNNYKRVDRVELFGEFSLRGDILDIFPCNHEYCLRVMFFDDTIESIIYYDLNNLTRIKVLDNALIAPNKLVFFQDNTEIEKLKSQEKVLLDIDAFDLPCELYPLFNTKYQHLFNYLDKPIIVYQNYLTINTQKDNLEKELQEKIECKFCKEQIKNVLKNALLEDNTQSFQKIYIENSEIYNADKKIINLESKHLNSYIKNFDLLKTDFSSQELKEKTIKLCLGNEFTFNAIKEMMFKNNIAYSLNEKNKGFVLTKLNIPYNICLKDDSVWYIGSSNFAHKKTTTGQSNKKIKYLPKAGEYVVHEIHGIGLCEGIVTLKVMGAEKDFFKIIYDKGDVLYVPTENTDYLSLYLGASDVKLNKLGGKEFALIKQRTEKAVEDMAKDLIALYAKRANSKGYKYSKDDYLMSEFENSFEFTETDDQTQAIEDIKHDMISGKVMDRLICGDVGYGKTEVALRAVFKAFLDNKQTAILAPTTILSLQHFMTCKKRFENFGVRVDMLNRFKTAKEKDEIIKKLKKGDIDVVCGTHSLLADNVEFKDLGLLVLDEEQRFGVKAKEKLKSLKNNVDVISMSATPIPRTLNMAMLTLRDISIINTPPKNRLPIKTYVTPFDMDMCVDAVKNEISRDGQVLIVYNDINKIFHFASQLSAQLNNNKCKFDVAHGKMNKNELENAIKRLYDKQTNVFVSTTLIENGVDLPKANTLIVLDSQNLGLSQLYQLRGRVGRSDEQAFAYFTYPKDKTITIEATERLEALAENTDLGSGFKIAMRDLQLRGAGELLGREQHGHMVKVGYDMYVKLLEEATKKLKGENSVEVKEVKLDIAISAKIPNNFIQDETEKLKIYSKISSIFDLSSQKDVLGSLKNAYGKLPKEVVQLSNIALIKALCQKLNIKHVVINKDKYLIEYYKDTFDVEKILGLLNKFNKISLLHTELPTIILNLKDFSLDAAQGYLIEYLCAQI